MTLPANLPRYQDYGPHRLDDYYDAVIASAQALKEIDEKTDWKKSARGWGYQLENEGVITKSDVDQAERFINKCRKNDFGTPFDQAPLPLDFTAQDDGRVWYCDDAEGHYNSQAHYAELKGRALVNGRGYDAPNFWEYQDYYLQVQVEKIDLVSLFKPICEEYFIPIATTKGWSSLNQRGKLIQRFNRWQQQGKRPVLLYCGDFDPPGMRISDNMRSNLADLEDALIPDGDGGFITGWRPDGLRIDRFGLNETFINDNNIPWVDNLETSGNGPPLDDRNHEDHDKPYVRNWLNEYGARKVEANALVAHPDAARDLFRDTVHGYLGDKPKAEYEAAIQRGQEQIRKVMEKHGVDEGVEAAIEKLR